MSRLVVLLNNNLQKVEPKLRDYEVDPKQIKPLVDHMECTKRLFVSVFQRGYDSFTRNGLLNAFLAAYNFHLPLCLRPDDLHIALQLTFSTFINKYAEKLRFLFVDHAGQKELSVEHTQLDFVVFSDLMKNRMKQNIKKPELIDVLLTTYATSSPLTCTVSNMLTMNTLKTFFNYEFVLSCGIPAVFLEGTIDDWLTLKQKFQYLKSEYFSLDPATMVWAEKYEFILNMLVEMRSLANDGQIDATSDQKELWSRVMSHIRYGSGGQTKLGGWVHLLFPYVSTNDLIDFKKMPSIDLSQKVPDHTYDLETFYSPTVPNSYIQDGMASTPANLNDNGYIMPIEFTSGFRLQPHLDNDGFVRANIGFSVAEVVD